MKIVTLVFVIFTIFGSYPNLASADKERQADVLMVALPASAFFLTLHKDDPLGSWALSKSLGMTAISTLALNAFIEKDSPNDKSNDAFPSGHTAIAFGSAAFIQKRYGWRSGVPAYAIASYVGWLRTDTDDHDGADVIGGAALGILSSYWLTKKFNDSMHATAWTDGTAAGLQLNIAW